ncbi:hypothetical protein LCGC14_1181890 [marine sediment metagenome]|uniref:DUF4184 family protein n=1 Tax=marine sediment metagenome TaxID=412755 RepID=A0A0F9M9L3_9ZZZZ
MPDIEYLFFIIVFPGYIPDHFILHSLIGAATIGTIISIMVTVYVYPVISSLLFALDKTRVIEICRLTMILVISCMLGNLFHILLDIFMHRFNSILWPFINPNDAIGIFTLIFAFEGDIGLGSIYASILIHAVFILLMISIFVKSRRNLWESILLGKFLEFRNEG